MKSAIFKVVVDGALAYSVVFIWVFDDGLLEVSAEVKDLTVILEPLRSNSRDRVIDVLWSLRDT